ncbi:MAG: hypothetical protein ACOC8F_01160 [Planctomycetota bacterium]
MEPGEEVAREIVRAAQLESRLREALAATVDEVARAECFDPEQRAEVYAILDSLRADSEAHNACIGQWVNDRTGEARDV